MPRGPAAAASPPVVGHGSGGAPRHYVCISQGGAIMRAGADMATDKVGVLEENGEIVAIQEVSLPNGTRRVECSRGWVSVCASDGTAILEELTPAMSPPDIRRMSMDSGGSALSAGSSLARGAMSPATQGVRSIAKDPALRQDQLKRFATERELLLRHSLTRLHKTQRLRLPRGQQIALLDSAQLLRIDCQDVMRCLRTGDGLDLSTDILPLSEPTGHSGEGEEGEEGEEEEEGEGEEGDPLFMLEGAQLVMASYETFVLSYNRLQPESYDSGRLEVVVVEAELLQGAGSGAAGQPTHATMGVGRMTARTTAKETQDSSCVWEEEFQFVVADGCQVLELQLYVGVQDAQGLPAARSLGNVDVPLAAVFQDGSVDTWYELSVSNGYKTRQTARVRLDMRFSSGATGLSIEVLERVQAAFGVSEVQHEEIVENLNLPEAQDAGVGNDGMSVEMMAKLQLRMQHRLAVPEGVCIGTCPHYRLLLLQNKRPRDFSSDKVFDEWQARQVGVVVNALLALVRRMDRTEREGMVEPDESSMLSDVERSL